MYTQINNTRVHCFVVWCILARTTNSMAWHRGAGRQNRASYLMWFGIIVCALLCAIRGNGAVRLICSRRVYLAKVHISELLLSSSGRSSSNKSIYFPATCVRLHPTSPTPRHANKQLRRAQREQAGCLAECAAQTRGRVYYKSDTNTRRCTLWLFFMII